MTLLDFPCAAKTQNRGRMAATSLRTGAVFFGEHKRTNLLGIYSSSRPALPPTL
jgi:hypothetical protein